MKILSPCRNKCTLSPKDEICSGCYRTLEEIKNWSNYSDKERAEIITKLPKRANAIGFLLDIT